MSLRDLLSMAKKNLLARKLRTFLTLLGVMIGTTAIIVMMSFGFGMTQQYETMITSMGDITNLNVMPNFGEGDKPVKLNDPALNEIRKIPHVETATEVYQNQFSLKYNKYQNEYVGVTALDPQAIDSYGWEIEEGKIFKDKGDREILFGSGVVSMFYNPKEPIEPTMDEEGNLVDPPPPFNANGKTIDLSPLDTSQMSDMFGNSTGPIGGETTNTKSIPVKVSGVLKEKKDFTVDNNIFMSVNTYKDILKEFNMPLPKKNDYQMAKIKVDDIDNVKEVEQKIKNMGFEVQGLFSILEEMRKGMGVVSGIFGGIGAISFVVAAIGITNTMIMSIYERTREIGVMKVIGASISDIKKLFLVEAGIIGLLGGIFGIIFSLLLSTIFNLLANQFLSTDGVAESIKISIVPIWLIFLAMLFSTLVGLAAGYFPARRAMNLSALDAIRSE